MHRVDILTRTAQPQVTGGTVDPVCKWMRDFSRAINREMTPGSRRPPGDWRPLNPKPIGMVRVLLTDGTEKVAHWAQDYSGECQPAFDGWFDRLCGDTWLPMAGKPVGWKPLEEAQCTQLKEIQ